MEPTHVGPYQIERKLGAGGMGTVYLARHSETGQSAAVKVLPPSLAREEGFVARFSREIEALKRLKNPHVVELYDSGVDGETYYYAMEYVDGETLSARMKRLRRLEWRDVIDISVQICQALKAAHDAGIIHRDLKPSNLMLTEDGQVKLTDFGVAQLFAGTKLTVTGGVIGTAEYMSPEQAQGKRITKKSDLYSLGAVMYVMLAGRPPFVGKTTIDIIQKHKYGQFDRPRTIVPEIPYWLDDIVCQLLEKDPDKRFADAYVLSLRLKEVVKKVELSGKDVTLTTGNFDRSTATAVDDTSAKTAEQGPGGGTLMRDLMRAEIDHRTQPTTVGQLLNNTWVLVGLLVLLVAGGFWWFRDRNPTQDENVSNSSPRWKTRSATAAEPERVIDLAKHYYESGDVPRAERTLSALLPLLKGDSEQESAYQTVQGLLDDLRGNRSQQRKPNRDILLRAAMERADRLQKSGNSDGAQEIWAGIVELYDSDRDPHVVEHVEVARKKLNEEKTAGP